MFKRLDPQDVNKTPFKVFKEFTVTNNDSGSGVYNFRAISGSTSNFMPLSIYRYPERNPVRCGWCDEMQMTNLKLNTDDP